MKYNGLYTIRVYDENRTPNTKEVENYEWISDPSIQNNGSEFLSSVIIGYKKDEKESEYLLYENTNYQTEVFGRYRKYKVGEYNTSLPTLADAQAKSETIMNISKEVQDIVERTTIWDNYGIEPSDFIICSPTTRENETPIRGIYEVLKVDNRLKKFEINLTMRFVKLADALPVYSTIDDNNDNNILDNNDFSLIGRIS